MSAYFVHHLHIPALIFQGAQHPGSCEASQKMLAVLPAVVAARSEVGLRLSVPCLYETKKP